jgi:hypothetical protein
MKELLEKLELYEINWIPYDSVIKLKSNDYTILIKHYGKWEWYNEKYFNEIMCDEKYKIELKRQLNPINGASEVINS